MRLIAALLLCLAAAGCTASGDPPPPQFPRISFQARPSFALDIARVVIEERNTPPAAPPHVGHRFPVPPIQAVRDWTSDRFQATGRSGELRVVVVSADAVEVRLPRTQGFTGAFTRDQSERYDVTIALRLELTHPETRYTARVEGRATRSATVAEDATTADKQVLWYGLVEGAMSAVDLELDRQIRAQFAPLLRLL